MNLGAQVVIALVVLGSYLLWLRTPARPRDEVDALAERKARELAGRDA